MIDCLVTRAAGRALALRTLTAEMGLEGGGTHCGAIRPAVPSMDRKFLLKLLQLEIGAHPPQAAVVRLTLRAEAGAQSKVQLGLFAPQTPEPSRLDVTLARLRAMVGEERVGSPVLEDTHRADGFRMEGFRARVSKSNRGRPHVQTLANASGDGGAAAADGAAAGAAAAAGAGDGARGEAGGFSRPGKFVRDCGGVWAVADERLLVGAEIV